MSKIVKTFAGRHYELIGLLFLVTGICANATVGIFARISDLSAVTTTFYRFMLANPLFIAYFLMFDRESLKLPRTNIKYYAIAGSCFVGGIISAILAFRMTTLANGELFGNLLPFVVIPLSWFLYNEKITWKFFFALLLAFCGIVIMMIGKIEPSIDNFIGDLLAFNIAVLYGMYVILVARIRKTKGGAHTLFYCSNVAVVLLFPYILIFEEQWFPGSLDSMLALIGLSWISHLVGAGLIVLGLGRVNQSLAAVIIMAQPVVGAFYGYMLAGEILSLMEITGIFICILGVIYAKFAAKGIQQVPAPKLTMDAKTNSKA